MPRRKNNNGVDVGSTVPVTEPLHKRLNRNGGRRTPPSPKTKVKVVPAGTKIKSPPKVVPG